MTVSPSQIDANRTLASVLAEQEPLDVAAALALIRNLALQVADLHAAGMIHGAIAPGSVVLNDRDLPRLETPATGTVLKVDGDWAGLLPELSPLPAVNLPATIEAAAKLFQRAGIALDPRQIDLCQLGALWCRVLTGESAGAYLRSPRVKGLVPVELRPLLERALGTSGRERFTEAREFAAALQAAAEQFGLPPTKSGVEKPATVVPSAAVAPAQSTSDTTPSFVLSGSQPADTSVAPGLPPAAHAAAGHTTEEPLPFVRLGHYEIVRKIGHGGMGDVYEGYEQALDRKVAIKVLPADLARSDDFVRRFRAEATAAARLIHPHIIQIYFIGEAAGHHYFAMQYVEGESLADLLQRRGKLAVDETLAIVEQALSGLSAAHEQGMVHRDIKPGNILLDTRHRRALLADFGLVKSLESVAGNTATGVVMGTVDYISPEQGRGLAVDGRSDLYSIGVLLYRMLSGQLPFTGDNPTALIFQHVYEPAPDLRRAVPDVPETLACVVTRLLAKSPADRHQTADDVLADLRIVRSGGPLPAPQGVQPGRNTAIIRLPTMEDEPPPVPAELAAVPPLQWWEQTRDRALSLFRRNAPEVLLQLQNTQQQVDGAVAVYERRQKGLQHLAQEAEAVLAELQKQAGAQRAGAAVARERVQAASDPTATHEAQVEESRCERAAAELDRQIADQQEQLEPIRLRLAQARAKVQQLGMQRDILNARLKAAQVQQCAADQSDSESKLKFRLGSLAIGVVVLAILVAVILPQEQISLELPQVPAEPTDAVEKASPAMSLMGHKAPVWCLALTADGNRVVSGSGEAGTQIDNSARVWDIRTGGELARFSGHRDRVLSVSTSPGGNQVLSASQDSTVLLWDADSGRQERSFGTNAGQIVQFAADGEHALFGGGGILAWHNVVDRQNSRKFRLGDQLIWNMAIDRNSTRALTCGGQINTFQLWDIATGKRIREFEGHRGWVERVAFTPDGQHALSASHDATIRLWKIDSGAQVRVFAGHERAVLAAAVSPDGRFVLSGGADSTVRLWNLETGAELARGTGHTGHVRAVEFVPDGLTAVSGGIDGIVRLWRFKAITSKH